MAFILLIYILLNNPLKQLKLLAGLAGSLFVAVYIAIVYMKFDIFDILGSRIEDFSQDGGSGRLELWGRAWDYFTTHMFFGIGAFNFADYNFFQYGDNLEVHNTFLDILSESGLVGISCFCLFILLVFIQLIKSSVRKNNPYLLLTFLGMILQMGFLSIIINDMFFMYLAILTTYLNNEKYARQTETQKAGSFHSIFSYKQKLKLNVNRKGSDAAHEYSSHNR